jgi:hypothetical protein
MPLTIRQRSQQVADYIQTHAASTIATIAEATGLHPSSVHRHRQGLSRRQQYPESSWWETAVGYGWLVRLVIAVVYHFGIKHSVGAESLSAFFKAIHLETQVGCSPTALRQLKHRVEAEIVAYEAAQTDAGPLPEGTGLWVGADETFFGLPVLVMMELASGFILTEVEANERTYESWQQHLPPWWDLTRWPCHGAVSDGAKALIKLAIADLGGAYMADVFHALRNVGRPIGQALGRQHAQVTKQRDALEEQINQTPPQNPLSPTRQAQWEELQTQQQRLHADQQTYHDALQQVSLTLHPFTLQPPQWQLAEAMMTQVQAPLQTLTTLATVYGGKTAQSALMTFQQQLPALSQGIHAWWHWVTHELAQQTQDVAVQNWVLMALLPWLYWSQQAEKTRRATLKSRYRQAASDAFDQLIAAPLTLQLCDADLQHWVRWGQWMCTKYQRTSSAIEGRNGYLTQHHHAARGFSERSLHVLTIVHNFDLKRPDGTTAAQRLFGHPFPDLFESVLSTFTELPRPRRSSQSPQPNPWQNQLVSA